MSVAYRKGSTGEMVKQIQKSLCGAGHHVGVIDGIFGVMTEEAVRNFQQEHGLTVDGIVGPATLMELIPHRWKKSKRKIDKIIVHCTATPEGEDATVEQIRKEHKAQGWSDIGYHYVVYRDGSIHMGRDVDIQGAHCAEHGGNIGSIGVCYVGGVEARRKDVAYKDLKAKDTRTEAQKASLLSLLIDLKSMYPGVRIYGHRDFSNKACPSFDALNEYRCL